MINFEQWEGFEGRIWKEEVNVRDFIQKNYTPYDGDESFLAGPTEATDKLWSVLYHDSLPTFSHPSKHHMTIGVSVTKPLNYASSSAQHCNR